MSRLTVVIAVVLSLWLAPPLEAQRSILLVGVGDAETGAFVPDAEVSVKGTGRRARTDAMGRARIAGLHAGQVTVEVRRVGYEPLSAPVLLGDRDSTDVVMMVLASPTRLPTIAVRETAPVESHLAEFETLRKSGQGRFVDVAATGEDRQYTLESFFLAHMPGMRLLKDGLTAKIMMQRGMACQPLVYLDGVMVTDGDVNSIDPKGLGAIAFFESGQIPPRYRRGGSGGPSTSTSRTGRPTGTAQKATSAGGDAGCGALVMWSR